MDSQTFEQLFLKMCKVIKQRKKRIDFSSNHSRTTGHPREKEYHSPYSYIDLSWTIDINVKDKTVDTLKENRKIFL